MRSNVDSNLENTTEEYYALTLKGILWSTLGELYGRKAFSDIVDYCTANDHNAILVEPDSGGTFINVEFKRNDWDEDKNEE